VRLVASVAVVALLGCQTNRQAISCAIVGAGVAGLGAIATYSARNDDEGPPLIFPIAIVAGGLTAVVSLISLAGDDDPTTTPPKPLSAPPPATPPVRVH
jgi:hypothetical protein